MTSGCNMKFKFSSLTTTILVLQPLSGTTNVILQPLSATTMLDCNHKAQPLGQILQPLKRNHSSGCAQPLNLRAQPLNLRGSQNICAGSRSGKLCNFLISSLKD